MRSLQFYQVSPRQRVQDCVELQERVFGHRQVLQVGLTDQGVADFQQALPVKVLRMK